MLRRKHVYRYLLAGTMLLSCLSTTKLSQAQDTIDVTASIKGTVSNQSNFKLSSNNQTEGNLFHRSDDSFSKVSLPQKSPECVAKAGSAGADYIKALALANSYLERGLNTKAIEPLEKLVDSGTQSAEIYFALGAIYGNGGWNQQAEENYTKALKLASATGELKVVVAAKAELANTEAVQGNTDAASRWRQEAQAGFESLKDVEQNSEVGQRLRRAIAGEQQWLINSTYGCGHCRTSDGHRGDPFIWWCLPCG